MGADLIASVTAGAAPETGDLCGYAVTRAGSISAIRSAWSPTDGAIACSTTLITWPGWERLAPTPAMARTLWTLSVTWPGIWPARCRASLTAIATGMNAASEQPGSHAVERFPDTRRPKGSIDKYQLIAACEYAGQGQKSVCSRHFESFQLRLDHHFGQFLVDLFRVWNIGHDPLRLLIT